MISVSYDITWGIFGSFCLPEAAARSRGRFLPRLREQHRMRDGRTVVNTIICVMLLLLVLFFSFYKARNTVLSPPHS